MPASLCPEPKISLTILKTYLNRLDNGVV
jgi:hypothetical protein